MAVGGVAAYVWVDYSQAQNSLIRSRLEVRDLAENIERHPEDVARLKEMYNSAKLQVDMLEQFHSFWIDKEELSAMRTALEKDLHDIRPAFRRCQQVKIMVGRQSPPLTTYRLAGLSLRRARFHFLTFPSFSSIS